LVFICGFPSRSHPGASRLPKEGAGRRVRPLPNPLSLLSVGEIQLYHAECGGRVSVEADDPTDIDAYAVVRCNTCFDTCRERQSALSRGLVEVLVGGDRSTACTVVGFLPLSPRARLTHGPLVSRLQSYFRRQR